MRTTQHTHRGNCQACGALQAMARGGQPLALHGYVVAGWGFFNGVCPGSRKLPLQLDRTYADEIIAQLTQRAADAIERAAALRAGTVTPSRVNTGKMVRSVTGKWEGETVAWADADEYRRRDAVVNAIYDCESDARQSTAHAAQLARLATELLGTAPVPVKPKAKLVELVPGMRFRLYGREWEISGDYDGRKVWCVPTDTLPGSRAMAITKQRARAALPKGAI